MNPGNFKADQLIFKSIKTLGRGDDYCQFIPIKRKCDDDREEDLLFITEKLFSFGARKNKGYEGTYANYTLPLCLWDEEKDSKDTIKKKKELLNALEAIGQECENYLEKEKIRHNTKNTKNNRMLSCLFNPDKKLSPILYANIDQDKKGKLLATLWETDLKSLRNIPITRCEYLMDNRWKVRTVLRVTGICLTEKYTSLKIKVVEGLFLDYTRPEAPHFLGEDLLSDSEYDDEDDDDEDEVESSN